MKDELFRPGGRYNVRCTGHDEYTMSLSMPTDEQGMTARECPEPECAPGYFKITFGTGVEDPNYDRCYCPYCRREGDQGDFLSRKQQGYAESVVEREAEDGIERMMTNALGLDARGLKSFPRRPVVMPFEEELRRDVTCPHCALTHAVFGLAVWCADCGKDIFLTHLAAELEVTRKVLAEVADRRERLDARVAARDIENGLEDAVSIFEAVMKFIYKRKLTDTVGEDEALRKLAGLRNAFQNPERSAQIARDDLGVDLLEPIEADDAQTFKTTFQKRHAITHNLGVVDRKYLEHGDGAGGLGREVPITVAEVSKTMDIVEQVLSKLYQSLFAA